jgi:antitoxin YefM
MTPITYSYARQHLAEAMKNACADHAPIIVTNKNNNSVVIISLEDYEGLQETAYLSRSPKNTRRLLESIKQLESGRGKIKKL